MELDKHSLITELQIKVINMADPHDTGISRQTSTDCYIEKITFFSDYDDELSNT